MEIVSFSIPYHLIKSSVMRWILLVALGLGGVGAYALITKLVPANKKVPASARTIDPRMKSEEWATELRRLQGFGARLENYAQQGRYNTRYCFLVDMKLPSGRNRMFLYDMQRDSILAAGLVTHGSGTRYSEEIQFSNEPGSYCTSPGRYKIGQAYYGKFGLAYKLHGLDATNSNAYSRAVVLHGHSCVPDREVFPFEICESQGCPTVSPGFLTELKTYLQASGKPILLWIVQ
jgi:hypothetical protein